MALGLRAPRAFFALAAVLMSLGVSVASAPLTVAAAQEADAQLSPSARRPRELGTLFAELVIQRVERGVSRDEVFAAVQRILTTAEICVPIPSVWLAAPPHAGAFVVRYDLMRRDWGEQTVSNARPRMDEFVASGFLTEETRDDIGEGVVRYDTTRAGRAYLRGSFNSGQRPRFCAPAERRLVEVSAMEWVDTECGTLRVRFTHVADDWPSWARHVATRERLEQRLPALGAPGVGEISLSRQWFAQGQGPRGITNGALISACMDADRERVIGDDLTFLAPQ